MALIPGTMLGPYEIVALIGSGGMGDVYRATDSILKRSVAVKVLRDGQPLDSQRLARFRREAEVLASLNHPHIAQVYGVEESGDVRALIMEFVEGPTLAERIAKGSLPLDEALTIGRQITAALDAAHQRGVVHRDLKPANIKLRPDGTVKVLDFGLAKVADEAVPQDATLSPTMTNLATMQGTLMGTAAYMSPEQARGDAVDRRADIWAFGVVLHEMVTGSRLFDGRTVADTVATVLVKDVDVTAAPPHLRPLLTACLERDVNRRLRDIGDAWFLIAEGPSVASVRTRRTKPFWLATVALTGAAAGFAGWMLGRPAPAAETRPMRLDVDLGPGISLPPVPNQEIAWSPDGTRMAYMAVLLGRDTSTEPPAEQVGRGRGAANPLATSATTRGVRVFVRQFDQQDQRKVIELPATRGGSNPTFSPDGQWIAFGIQGQIHKVSIEGGVDVVLSSSPAGLVRSILWPEENRILFTAIQTQQVSVFELQPSTGTVRTVATAMAADYRLSDMLPGSTHVLATRIEGSPGQILSSGDGTSIVEALSLADGSRKPLINGGLSARYLPTGHLLFMRGGTLFGVRFDPQALETRGAYVSLLTDLMFTRSGRTAYSVGRNGTLAYRDGGEATNRLATDPQARLEWVDPSGKRTPVTTETGPYSRPRISPDGHKLAVLISEPDSRDEHILDLDSGRWTRITFGAQNVSTVAWSADSQYLFIGSGGTGIHWARADGLDPPQPLTNVSGTLPFVSSYSAAAQRLMYFMPQAQGSDIFSLPLTQSGGRWQAGPSESFPGSSTTSEEQPVLSPDGRWLAYTSDEFHGPQVYVRPFPAGRAGGKITISRDGGENPHWSPMTNELLYSSGEQIWAVSYTQTDDTFVAAPQPRLRAKNVSSRQNSWDLHPDGRILTVIPEEAEPVRNAQPYRTLVLVQNFIDEVVRKLPNN